MTSVDGTPARSRNIPEFDWDALPLIGDRGVGWKALRDKGRVLYSQGWYHLTAREDVTYALRNPEILVGAGLQRTRQPAHVDPDRPRPSRAHPVPAHPAAI